MATLGDFLQTLFEEGRMVLQGRPSTSKADRDGACRVLESAFDEHRLDVAGPAIGFEPGPAIEAAELLRLSAWFLVNRSESAGEVARSLRGPRPPLTAGDHLSADVCFRFLPFLERRARAMAPVDALAIFLADMLRAWPLSGVLSDLAEGPEVVGELGGHPGLWMLYAERLAQDEKPAWLPRGAPLGHLDLVFASLGRSRSARLDGFDE